MCGMFGWITVYDLNTEKRVMFIFIDTCVQRVYRDKSSAYGLQINMFAEPNRWTIQCVCFGYQGLAVAVSSNRRRPICQLSFWKMVIQIHLC